MGEDENSNAYDEYFYDDYDEGTLESSFEEEQQNDDYDEVAAEEAAEEELNISRLCPDWNEFHDNGWC
ncbi:MAG TPA: hypothetical protein VJZ01_08880 [Lachnospiraceae bacterium]|nr:hypothetical protein [Lachnospiraceae bacterium]